LSNWHLIYEHKRADDHPTEKNMHSRNAIWMV